MAFVFPGYFFRCRLFGSVTFYIDWSNLKVEYYCNGKIESRKWIVERSFGVYLTNALAVSNQNIKIDMKFKSCQKCYIVKRFLITFDSKFANFIEASLPFIKLICKSSCSNFPSTYLKAVRFYSLLLLFVQIISLETLKNIFAAVA